jgi:hypothetical protein
MSSQQVRSNDATASPSVASVDMKLEVSSSPSRMSIAQRSSIQGAGGGSTPTAPPVTTFEFTPPGSGSSVQFGVNLTSAAPGSAQGLPLAVSDIEAAREELVAHGVDASEGFTVQPGLPAGFQAPASGSAGHTPSVSVTGRWFRSVVPIGAPAFNRSLGAKWPRI